MSTLLEVCVVFYRDSTAFQEFVSQIEAKGGLDDPEDVMGGLKAVSELAWRFNACKVCSEH